MTITTHKRSIRIDAPVERVFDYVKDPHNQFAAYYQEKKPTIAEEAMTADSGEGSTWKWKGQALFLHLHGTNTRVEFVPNVRIVDRSSTGAESTFTFEPDRTGTTLSIAIEISSKVPYLDKLEDAVIWSGDRDLDTWLANLKEAIEAGTLASPSG